MKNAPKSKQKHLLTSNLPATFKINTLKKGLGNIFRHASSASCHFNTV